VCVTAFREAFFDRVVVFGEDAGLTEGTGRFGIILLLHQELADRIANGAAVLEVVGAGLEQRQRFINLIQRHQGFSLSLYICEFRR